MIQYLRNPIQLRLEKLKVWQQVTFMACLCERMFPNYYYFCEETQFADPKIFRNILDLIWESLIVKEAIVNFDAQLEKLEDLIPHPDDFAIYAVYPAIDACKALSELLHSLLGDEVLEHAVQISAISASTVADFESAMRGSILSEEEINTHPAIIDEWDLQWEIFRLLMNYSNRDPAMIKGLRSELREVAESNIGINIAQKNEKK